MKINSCLHMHTYICDFKKATFAETENSKDTILKGRAIKADTSSYTGVKRLKDILE